MIKPSTHLSHLVYGIALLSACNAHQTDLSVGPDYKLSETAMADDLKAMNILIEAKATMANEIVTNILDNANIDSSYLGVYDFEDIIIKASTDGILDRPRTSTTSERSGTPIHNASINQASTRSIDLDSNVSESTASSLGIEEAIAVYQEMVETFRPNAEDLDGIEGMTIVENNIVIDDMIIPLKSIEAGLFVIAKKAEIAGIPDSDIEDMFDEYLPGEDVTDEGELSRSLSYNSYLYPSTIRFLFADNVRELYREFVREATEDWEILTGGVVNFSEVSDPLSESFYAIHGLSNTLYIVERTDSEIDGAAGRASPIGVPYAMLELNADIENDDDMRNTVIPHELGHVLSLAHEHQRTDRNEHLIVSSADSTNMDVLDLTKTITWYTIDWRTRRVKVGWFYITYKWPVKVRHTKSIELAAEVGEFDCSSIMLYSNIPIRAESKCLNDASTFTTRDGVAVTRRNDTISSGDVQGVLHRYAN